MKKLIIFICLCYSLVCNAQYSNNYSQTYAFVHTTSGTLTTAYMFRDTITIASNIRNLSINSTYTDFISQNASTLVLTSVASFLSCQDSLSTLLPLTNTISSGTNRLFIRDVAGLPTITTNLLYNVDSHHNKFILTYRWYLTATLAANTRLTIFLRLIGTYQ
jgi:hypothetical protein